MDDVLNFESNTYPVVALRDGIIFPTTENALLFGRGKSVMAIKHAMDNGKKIVLVMQKDAKFDDPSENELFDIGVLAHIEKILEDYQERLDINNQVQYVSRFKNIMVIMSKKDTQPLTDDSLKTSNLS